MEVQSPQLSVSNIHKTFGDNEVLKGISFDAMSGEVITLIGSSGSGKSTLLRCINLLEIPTQGEVILRGEPVRFRMVRGERVPTSPQQVQNFRSRLAMVFQGFNLWSHMTVLENVIEAPVHVLGQPKKQAIEKAEALLDKVGLLQRKNYYPNHLSGGQQQRAAIARALAMDPEVLLFDEPTSALDPELVNEVLRVMRGLAEEGRTMILVTHEMDFARDVSNKVLFLHQGKIEEQGDPGKIFTNPDSERVRQFMAAQNR
ncbi:ABC transporter ATP-binding protein [Pseudomaricurvus sp. HS19]|uniref:ABC transporter ATP-binding protein n=1 Tax=Pseudomaricurvus sp. HS19 TaxID=2692626 RepID=UPI00137209DD|nr:ATP-binding cassette domain-containing protein [Pseudomaricurvus sp. HS19]MYM63052.1 ATP-binding cassette domain-containing protein [Pseudomaricurvus sp. HS19]